MRRLCLQYLSIAGAIALPASVFAAAPRGDLASLERFQDALADVADQVRPSVVAIRAERKLDAEDLDRDIVPNDEVHAPLRERRYPAVGTGVLISSDGHILTNEHVIHNAYPEDIECVLFDGRSYTAQGITSDPRSDLAIVKLDVSGLHAARFGDNANVRQGHFVIVMGNPFGAASENAGRSAMSLGIVSSLGQDLTQKLDLSQQHYYGNLIQTDAKINPGNSGGPLFNVRGEVIGITTAISTRSGMSDGIGYAIPIDDRVKQIVAHLKKGEEVEYGFLGLNLERPTQEQRRLAGAPATGGVFIREVTPGAPAAGKLLEGDIVVEFNKNRIMDVDQLIRLVGAAPVGTEVEVKVYRGSRLIALEVVPVRKNVLKGVHMEAPLTWRGMKIADLSSELRETYKLADKATGVVVTRVDDGGDAFKAGLKPGFVIQKVGQKAIRELRELRDLLPRLSGPTKIKGADSGAEITLP